MAGNLLTLALSAGVHAVCHTLLKHVVSDCVGSLGLHHVLFLLLHLFLYFLLLELLLVHVDEVLRIDVIVDELTSKGWIAFEQCEKQRPELAL